MWRYHLWLEVWVFEIVPIGPSGGRLPRTSAVHESMHPTQAEAVRAAAAARGVEELRQYADTTAFLWQVTRRDRHLVTEVRPTPVPAPTAS